MGDFGLIPEVIEITRGSYSIGDHSIPNAAPKHQRNLESSVWVMDAPFSWELFEALLEAGCFANSLRSGSINSIANVQVGSVDRLISELLEFSLEMECEAPWCNFSSRKLPVTGLNWFAVSSIAEFMVARLPSEIEWEIAMKVISKSYIKKGHDLSGHLEEWTSDSFSPKYWRADFSKRGVPWKPGSSKEVTIRGSAPDGLHKHVCFRQGADPGSFHSRRGFRLAWDKRPTALIMAN